VVFLADFTGADLWADLTAGDELVFAAGLRAGLGMGLRTGLGAGLRAALGAGLDAGFFRDGLGEFFAVFVDDFFGAGLTGLPTGFFFGAGAGFLVFLAMMIVG
jgi:hypothetical protein